MYSAYVYVDVYAYLLCGYTTLLQFKQEIIFYIKGF